MCTLYLAHGPLELPALQVCLASLLSFQIDDAAGALWERQDAADRWRPIRLLKLLLLLFLPALGADCQSTVESFLCARSVQCSDALLSTSLKCLILLFGDATTMRLVPRRLLHLLF